MASKNSFDCKKTLKVNGKEYTYFSLATASETAPATSPTCPIR
jgi:hypothetical protein